jgi:hypothetical protein
MTFRRNEGLVKKKQKTEEQKSKIEPREIETACGQRR